MGHGKEKDKRVGFNYEGDYDKNHETLSDILREVRKLRMWMLAFLMIVGFVAYQTHMNHGIAMNAITSQETGLSTLRRLHEESTRTLITRTSNMKTEIRQVNSKVNSLAKEIEQQKGD